MVKIFEPSENFLLVRTQGEGVNLSSNRAGYIVRYHQKNKRLPEEIAVEIRQARDILSLMWAIMSDEEKLPYREKAAEICSTGFILFSRENMSGTFQNRYGANEYGKLRR